VDDPAAAVRNDPQHEVAFWREQGNRKFAGNQHLVALWDETWLPAMLQSPYTRRLLHCASKKRLLKELSEGYGVLLSVRAARRRRQPAKLATGESGKGGAEEGDAVAWTGEGAVFLDVCCGKGIGAIMLASALPAARVMALDSNPDMDLTHLRCRPNLEFRLVDVFTGTFPATVAQSLQGAAWGAVVGTHLCGALSPRLISVFRRCLGSVHCLVLSPCCLKGWGGKEAQKRAKARGVDAYVQLCEDLCGLVTCSDVMGAPAVGEGETLVAEIFLDVGIASVRNRLIIAQRERVAAV